MSRYIDADTLKKRVEDSNKSAGLHLEDLRKIRRWINTAPSIDIVFCKDCKWGKPYSDKQLECDALGLGGLKFPNDFCSYGVKKGADDDD